MRMEKWFKDDLQSLSGTGLTRRRDGSAVQQLHPSHHRRPACLRGHRINGEKTRETVPPKLQEAIRAAGQPCQSAGADLAAVLMFPADEAKGSVHLQYRQDCSDQGKLSR